MAWSDCCNICVHFHPELKCPYTSLWDLRYCDYDEEYHKSGEHCDAFQSKSSCYLTSACVGYLGKPDDCYELTTLRTFRDGYLKTTEEGKAIVEQYYKIAPKIVEKIDASNKQKEYYEYIYSVVKECVTCIEKGEQESALSRYRDMTIKLQTELLEK